MTCAGSATSGHGLTGLQVRSALSALVDDILEQWGPEEQSSTALPTLAAADFEETKMHHTSVKTADGIADMKVTEFSPKVFETIRRLSGVDSETFAKEWDLHTVDLQLGAGRSNALFFPSKNRVFLCKTIALSEVEVLMHILASYTKHLLQYPETFLTRFFLMMKVEVEGEVGYISCFHDVCANAHRIHEKWDIKGRVPKPGKYLDHPNECPSDGLPRVDTVFGEVDEDFDLERESEDTELHSPLGTLTLMDPNAQTMHGTSVTVKKDKELNRLFWVKPTVRNALLRQLHIDYEYLGRAGLMDYSLFVGVSHTPTNYDAGRDLSTIRRMHPVNEAVEVRGGLEADGQEAKLTFASPTTSNPHGQKFSAGIPSFRSQEVYYIGIIDMLTEYTFKKKLANFFKSFLWKDETLSTIPPKPYKERVERFTRGIFPKMVPQLSVTSPQISFSSPNRAQPIG